MDSISDLARLIHEGLEQIGWKEDPLLLANRVRRLNIGLPLEDEFSTICGWLGRCKLIHKLDQQQYPVSSKEKYQVPDLIATFETEFATNQTVLIEVKSCSDKLLSLKPDYYMKLKAYAALVNLPIMIAWKLHGCWVLISIDEFKLAKRNYNLLFNIAITKSRMGDLVGDFCFHMQPNAGFHLKSRILARTSIDSDNEQLKLSFEDHWFTDEHGREVRDLSPLAQKVFLSWPTLTEQSHITETHFVFSSVCSDSIENEMVMAHQALVNLLMLKNFNNPRIIWRSLMIDDSSTKDIQDFRSAVYECVRKRIVRTVFEFAPVLER